MDALQDWALAYPAVARLLWVIVLVLATLLVWSFFFCCWDSRSSVSPLETYLSGHCFPTFSVSGSVLLARPTECG
ncbi:hypothetical protein SRHO_G00014510 [Serrasalmus rhombeus]